MRATKTLLQAMPSSTESEISGLLMVLQDVVGNPTILPESSKGITFTIEFEFVNIPGHLDCLLVCPWPKINVRRRRFLEITSPRSLAVLRFPVLHSLATLKMPSTMTHESSWSRRERASGVPHQVSRTSRERNYLCGR
jgi:hypothetical protein